MAEDRKLDPTVVRSAAKPEGTRVLADSPEPVAADLSGFELAEDHSQDSRAGAFVGRYQILSRLGKGGFGIVYLAKDAELDRLVAVKIPHLHRMQSSHYQKMYLTEARTLAKLDHPSVVPIYDCGVINDGRCFVVSKYIEGQDLSRAITQGPLSASTVAQMISDVAEALHHVHQARIVHRDIKPANLLLGKDGRIYVADFGLALRDDPVISHTDSLAGTPNYMSPEQVRGEGHRVDGRSDQFSLGVVMYEMMTGERPFSGGASHDVLYRIMTQDPIPPRQLNRNVPPELNRICLKLLSKLASQRYHETLELSVELKDWLKKTDTQNYSVSAGRTSSGLVRPVGPTDGSAPTVNVIPRGLRAFTRSDAYFFLELLPGTRDREGLPASLGHWKRWVSGREEMPDDHRVGVISGPTGCGKSSFVRAGLLPLLGSDVVTVILEATPDLTERQMLTAIERHCTERTAEDLPDTLATIRRGQGISPRKSLLIIIDQFEQWLHAHPDPQDSELVRAIRQCDGIRVQCILLIRDDFWLGLCRFMEAVETPLQLGRNAMMIDLFDRRHARKVLIEFGRGYNQLPAAPEPLDRDQERFIEGAIDNLMMDGKIVPVHLALLAEMVKSKDWTPGTLRVLGGTVGIGAQFLHESFSATYAPANQRAHDEAARSILQALVPGLGTEIKASRKTRAELLTLSGYETERSRFDMLMTILESDLKLISAAESLDRTRSQSSPSSTELTTYQLSHDFLVPSIREWLTARQRESFQGRLHQRLTEQACLWNQQKEARFLPNLWEWLLIRACLSRKQLTAAEAAMLSVADRRSARILSSAIAVLLIIAFGLRRYQSHNRVTSLTEQLTTADSDQILLIADELSKHGTTARSLVDSAISETPENSDARFALQLAKLKWSDAPVEKILEHVIAAPTIDPALVAGTALIPFADQVAPECWRVIQSPATGDSPELAGSDDARIRAVLLLAAVDPPDKAESIPKWESAAQSIAGLLVEACAKHPDRYSAMADTLQVASSILIPPLSVNLGVAENDLKTGFAISLLSDFSQSNPELRTRLCLDASDWQKPLIVPAAANLSTTTLWNTIRAPYESTASSEEHNTIARRRAMAVALLLAGSEQQNSEELWSHLKRTSDNVRNTTRSSLIRLMSERGVPLQRLISQLSTESDFGIQYALILAMGDYTNTANEVTGEMRSLIRSLYQTSPDAGVHSAAEWLLKRWGETDTLASLPAESPASARSGPVPPRQWMKSPKLDTCDGHTLIRVDARSHPKIGREFLIGAHEVTVRQVADFNPGQYCDPQYSRTPDSPMCVVEWRMAVAYCNWLSRREGLPEFYPGTDEEAENWNFTEEDLKKPGYRLPMEAEWETASLAGSQTDRFFGTEAELIFRYAWCLENANEYLQSIGLPLNDPNTKLPITVSKPVGLKRPNDFGLFDVYGNVAEWCNDIAPIGERERGIRGGAAGGDSRFIHSGPSGSAMPRQQYNSNGFRVARTIETR